MKDKLNVDGQVEHMKSRGVLFNIMSEDDARNYLTNNTYYFKIKAYAKNYGKYQIGDRAGQYVNLEFAYLKDLAIIDMLLRHYIFKVSIDLEHAVKVRFLNDFNSTSDDGYRLVGKFLDEHPEVLDDIKRKRGNSYTSDLVNKLLREGFAIWNVIELLSLKNFMFLYRRFYEEYPESRTGIDLYYPMQAVRKLRNAAAHNNCLINSLRKPYSGEIRYNGKVDRFISGVKNISKESRRHNKSNQVIYDFITMLYLVDEVVSSREMKRLIFAEARELFHGRMVRHKDYYSRENSITSAYLFVNKIVDFLYEKAYNVDEI